MTFRRAYSKDVVVCRSGYGDKVLPRIQRLSGRVRVRLVVIASLSSCSRTHVCRASGSLEAFNVLGEGGDVRGVEGGPGLSECI